MFLLHACVYDKTLNQGNGFLVGFPNVVDGQTSFFVFMNKSVSRSPRFFLET